MFFPVGYELIAHPTLRLAPAAWLTKPHMWAGTHGVLIKPGQMLSFGGAKELPRSPAQHGGGGRCGHGVPPPRGSPRAALPKPKLGDKPEKKRNSVLVRGGWGPRRFLPPPPPPLFVALCAGGTGAVGPPCHPGAVSFAAGRPGNPPGKTQALRGGLELKTPSRSQISSREIQSMCWENSVSAKQRTGAAGRTGRAGGKELPGL